MPRRVITPQTTDEPIINRFFEAMTYLKEERVVEGFATITKEIGMDRRNLYKIRKDPANKSLRLYWLAGMVERYNISANWLLTGQGEMIDDKA